MAQGRGLFTTIFKNFWNSIKPRQYRGKLVGEDYYGTKYYEIVSDRQRNERYFEPVNKRDFDQEIPAEWHAWLRGRRKVPPTKEELEQNYAIMQLKKKNAYEMKLQQKGPEYIEAEKKTSSFHTFPVYEEYEKTPGEHIDQHKK